MRFSLLIPLIFALGVRAAEPSASADLAALRTRLADRENPLTWVFTGDSVTQGAKWLGRERSYPEVFQERLRWELNRRRDIVINSAISGQKADGVEADFDWRVRQFHPAVVSVMLGINDSLRGPAGRAGFAAALRTMIRAIRAAGAIPILHTTNTVGYPDPDSEKRPDLPAYNAMIREVAAAEGVILVDHWKRWQAEPGHDRLDFPWRANALHPNAAGHRQLALELFRTLGLLDPGAASCAP